MNEYRSGNVAYDLTLFDPVRNQFASAQIRQRVKNSSMAKARKKAIINIFLALAVTVMCVTWLACYSHYNEINSSLGTAKKEYLELINEKEKLSLMFDEKYDLRAIESIAVNKLGMTRVKSDNITYIDTMGADKSEIVATDTNLGVTLMRKLFGG